MTTPIVRRTRNQSSRSQELGIRSSQSLPKRRLMAWATEIALVVVSGLVPFGIGAFANSRSDLGRVPLNPVLGVI